MPSRGATNLFVLLPLGFFRRTSHPLVVFISFSFLIKLPQLEKKEKKKKSRDTKNLSFSKHPKADLFCFFFVCINEGGYLNGVKDLKEQLEGI